MPHHGPLLLNGIKPCLVGFNLTSLLACFGSLHHDEAQDVVTPLLDIVNGNKRLQRREYGEQQKRDEHHACGASEVHR